MNVKRVLVGCWILSIALSFSNPAYAYLDPGSASLVVQGIVAAIAGAAGVAAMYWSKTKQFLRSLFTFKAPGKSSKG